jgi:hypothetical protein
VHHGPVGVALAAGGVAAGGLAGAAAAVIGVALAVEDLPDRRAWIPDLLDRV